MVVCGIACWYSTQVQPFPVRYKLLFLLTLAKAWQFLFQDFYFFYYTQNTEGMITEYRTSVFMDANREFRKSQKIFISLQCFPVIWYKSH